MARPTAESSSHQVRKREQQRPLARPGREHAAQTLGRQRRLPQGHRRQVLGQVGARHRTKRSREIGFGDPAPGPHPCEELLQLVEEHGRVALAGVDQLLEHGAFDGDPLAGGAPLSPREQVAARGRCCRRDHLAGGPKRLERFPWRLGGPLDQHQRRAARRTGQPFGESGDLALATAQVLDVEHDREFARREQRGAVEGRQDLVHSRLRGAKHARGRGLGATFRPPVT